MWLAGSPRNSQWCAQTGARSSADILDRRTDAIDCSCENVVASSLLGEDFNYGSGDGHYYVGDTHWHPDEGNTIWGYEPGSDAFAIKVAFYLDPVRADTGALRVIPRSHLNGGPYRSNDGTLDPEFMAAINDADGPLGQGSSENGNIALESDPGDLVVFNHKVLHSAWGGGVKRRMFTMVSVLVAFPRR